MKKINALMCGLMMLHITILIGKNCFAEEFFQEKNEKLEEKYEVHNRLYGGIDLHALTAPADVERDMGALVSYLTQRTTSEAQKTRAIARWIADRVSYDVNSMFYPDQIPSGSEVLKARRTICSGYAQLFLEMAGKAGLRAEMVIGHVRDYKTIRIGDVTGKILHAWNAVLVEGRWQLLDITWSAGSINGHGQFEKNFNNFYFFTKPEYLIYSHYPDNANWQLLKRPIESWEFPKLPHLSPAAFAFGFLPESHPQNQVIVRESANIKFSSSRHLDLIAEYDDGKGNVKPVVSSVEPSNYEIHVPVPGVGYHVLNIFGRENKNENFKFLMYYDIISGVH